MSTNSNNSNENKEFEYKMLKLQRKLLRRQRSMGFKTFFSSFLKVFAIIMLITLLLTSFNKCTSDDDGENLIDMNHTSLI